jgi:hypothetical protein
MSANIPPQFSPLVGDRPPEAGSYRRLGKTRFTDLVNDHDGGVFAKSWLRFWEETGYQREGLESRDSLVGWMVEKKRGAKEPGHNEISAPA